MDTGNSQQEHAKGHHSNKNLFNQGHLQLPKTQLFHFPNQETTLHYFGTQTTESLINGIQLHFEP
jgi:hypothetical protein